MLQLSLLVLGVRHGSRRFGAKFESDRWRHLRSSHAEARRGQADPRRGLFRRQAS